MSKHVISTLGADVKYTRWVNSAGLNTVEKAVLVRGGAGVTNKALITPDGVRTEVSDEDAEFLAQDPMFKFHQERGHVKIVSMARDPDDVAQSMEKDDGTRPRNEKDVEKFAKEKGLGKEPGTDLKATTNKK
jgi:hypothetical protein